MAINATPVQSVQKYSSTHQISIGVGDGWAAPTAGNLLVVVASIRVDSVTVNVPTLTGWEIVQSDYTGNASARGLIAWKAAVGGDSTIAFDVNADDTTPAINNFHVVVTEFANTDLDLTAVEASGENKVTGGGAASVTPASTTNTTADALCLSCVCIAVDNGWNTTGPSVSGSYTIVSPDPTTGGSAGAYLASKVVSSSANQSPAWTTTDTGGPAWAATVIFAESAPVPAVTFDASTKTLSASTTTSITVTASPAFSGAMTTLTAVGGDAISAEGGATTSSATFLIPALTQFIDGGTMNDTRIGAAESWTVTAGAQTATASLTLQPPTGYYLTTLTATTGTIAAAITGEAIGDDVLAWGDLDVIYPDGTFGSSTATGTVNYRWYDVDTTAWSADASLTYGAVAPQTLTLDADTAVNDAGTYYRLPVAGEFAYTLDPVVEIPDSINIAGVALATTDATTAGDTSVTMPVVSDFMSGTWNAIPWYNDLTLTIGFPGSPADLTATVQIEGPAGNTSGSTYWHGLVGDPSGIFTGFSEGDLYFIEVTSGVISAVTSTGVIYSPEAGGADVYRHTAGAWAEETPITFELNLAATTPGGWVVQRTGISQVNDAWIRFLAEEGFIIGSLNDRMMLWLEAEGYPGALSDRLSAWIRANLIPHI